MSSTEFFHFDPLLLQAVTSGRSPLDDGRLHIANLDQADLFLKSYGFDWASENQRHFLASVYRRSIVFAREQLEIGDLPSEISDLSSSVLGDDLRQLLLMASGRSNGAPALQSWACGVLRVMHVFIHIENDMSNAYAEEIQAGILTPFEQVIRTDGKTGKPTLFGGRDHVLLEAFERKPFKSATSTILKLLARSDLFTLNVFDKIGVRFVADSIFDVFRVLRILIQENLIAVPHLMSDQSSNNLYPTALFCKVVEETAEQSENWQALLKERLNKALAVEGPNSELFRKENHLSAKDYRFIKFITRKLIRIPTHGAKDQDISFFYPFEIQILDRESFAQSKLNESSHQAYKNRQRRAARNRAFPESTS